MKFSCQIDINVPIHMVIKLFENPDNLKEWQDGFKSITPVAGIPGEVGSKSKLTYEKLELIETILRNELPEEFKATYEHKHMVNTMSCKFEKIDAHITRLEQEIYYTKFNGFLPKLMAKLFPGLFKKQVQKWLHQFKTFAESQNG